MTAADVKLVMHHVRAGREIGDEIEAVGAGRAGSCLDSFTRQSSLRSRGTCIHQICAGIHFHSLRERGQLHWEVQDRRRIGKDSQRTVKIAEAFVGDVDRVIASRNGVDLEAALVVGDCFFLPIGRTGMQRDTRVANRVMLGVVDDAAHRAENAREDRGSEPGETQKRENAEKHSSSPDRVRQHGHSSPRKSVGEARQQIPRVAARVEKVAMDVALAERSAQPRRGRRRFNRSRKLGNLACLGCAHSVGGGGKRRHSREEERDRKKERPLGSMTA